MICEYVKTPALALRAVDSNHLNLGMRYAFILYPEQAAGCDYVFLGVKPQMMEQLFSDLAPILQKKTGRTILVSMAAGITMARIQAMAGEEYPVIRIMPNTPVEVGSGVVLYDATQTVTEAELEEFCAAMQHCGLLDRLPEALMDAGTSVAGCGPAFACLFMALGLGLNGIWWALVLSSDIKGAILLVTFLLCIGKIARKKE